MDKICKYSNQEKVKHFFINAKSWNGSVDKVFMDKIITKLKSNLGSYLSFNGDEILRLLSQIKTRSGMGYLVKNFKLDDGNNLYQALEKDKSFSWKDVINILEKNFNLPYGPSGCGNML